MTTETGTGRKFLIAILCALAGGIVGSIPAIASVFILKYIFGVLYAFIPFAIYYGYKRGGGSRSITMFVTIAISVVYTVLLVLGVLYYQLVVEHGTVTVQTYAAFLISKEALPLLIDYILDALLFSGVGVWMTWRHLRKAERQQ